MRFLAFFVLLLATRASAAPLTCTVNNVPTPVKPAQIKASVVQLKQALKKKAVHVLDLPGKARELRERIEQPYEDPCMRYADILALRAAVDAMSLDQQHLNDKATRLRRWHSGATLNERERKQTQRWLDDAAADIERDKLPKANLELNAALFVILHNKDLWHLPDSLPQPKEEAATANLPTVNDDEIELGCPKLAKRSIASRDDYNIVEKRLGATMNQRGLRLGDIKNGSELLTASRALVEQGALWPATRLLCGVVARMQEAAIDVGVVSGRFQKIRELRADAKLSKTLEMRFSELVAAASEHIAASQFQEANQLLEQLLVMLGAPSTPSAEL